MWMRFTCQQLLRFRCKKMRSPFLGMLRYPDRNLAMPSSEPFKWRHFQSNLILLNVRWYLRYGLSYRDLEEMMLERGVKVDHTTIYRWV